MRTARPLWVLIPLVVVVLAWGFGWPAAAAGPDERPMNVPFGEPLPGLTAEELHLFHQGKDAFEEEELGEEGLGPTFNDVGCGTCHFQAATGGASEIVETRAASYNDGVYREFPGGSLFQSQSVRPECSEKVPPRANVRAL